MSSLADGNPYLHRGTHVVVGRGKRKLHVLSVHLKSGCWGASQDEQGREACIVLRTQMNALRDWIDERQANGERFAIAGDFNRRLTIPDDWAWKLPSSEHRPLELATDGRQSRCDSRFPNLIDHIVLGGPDGPIGRAGSFREEARDGRHPDNCASSVALADGPPSSDETRAAHKAWTSAFARTSTDQIVGNFERRLSQGAGSCATASGIAVFQEDRAPSVEEILSRDSFRFSPSEGSGAPRWSLWGAGTAGSMSAREHDLEARVRTATLGTDVVRGAATLGIALSHTRGRGSTLPTGPIDAELTSVAPYAEIAPRDGVRLWGMVGRGDGKLSFEPATGRPPMRTDIETTLGALGLRADLGEAYEVRWTTRASAELTAIETRQLAELDPIDSTVGRLRAGIEGSQQVALHDAGVLIPSVDLGLRHDVGDDANGSALRLGAGLQYLSAEGRLNAAGHAKVQFTNADEEGWEIGGRLVLSPGPRGRGLSLAVTPTWGASGMVGRMDPMDPLHSSQEGTGAGSLNAEIGYAMAFGEGRGTVRPYTRTGWATGGHRTMQFGTRWRLGDRTNFTVMAGNNEPPDEMDSFAVIAKARIRW